MSNGTGRTGAPPGMTWNDWQQAWLETIRIQDMPDLGAVTDSSSFVGEHAGSGRFAATAVRSYLGGSFLPTTGGTVTANLGTTPNTAAVTVNATPTGSGVNGPANFQLGLNVSNVKSNFPSTTVVGEIDGINVFCRQAGPTSDCSGILVNVQNTGASYESVLDGTASFYNLGSNSITRQVFTYLGSLDAPNNAYYGLALNSTLGVQTAAIMIENNAGVSYWGNALVNFKDGIENFVLDDSGNILRSNSVATTKVVVGTPGAAPTIQAGTGAATGTQPAGSLWLRTDGTTGARVYVSAGGGTWNVIAGV